MVAHATPEVETGGSSVQGQSQLQFKLKASVGYRRLSMMMMTTIMISANGIVTLGCCGDRMHL